VQSYDKLNFSLTTNKFNAMNYPGHQPQSICILRLSAIGDVCNAVAAVQAIQRRWPEIKITWVIGKIEAMLLDGLPGVEFIIFDKKAGLQGYRDLRATLKGRKFDVLLQMQVALRASIAGLCIKATYKVGFDKKRAKEGQWLFGNRRIKAQVKPHVLDGFMAFAEIAGVTDLTPQWQMPLNELDLAWAKQHFDPDRRTLVIAPAASKAERNWQSQHYAAIVNHVNAIDWNVILCGGPTTLEQDLGQQITTHCTEAPLNLIGKTTLKQLLAVLKHADIVLAPDTGPAHMAVTVATPVIGLYAHSNPQRTGPYRYQDLVVSSYLETIVAQQKKPISMIKWGTRAKGEHLMDTIKVQDVINKLETAILDLNLTPKRFGRLSKKPNHLIGPPSIS
jgi:heptosyltransferase I